MARVHNLEGLLTEVIKISNLSILPIVSIVFYCLPIVSLCSNFDTPLEVQDVH